MIVEALPLMDDGGETRFIIVGGDENSGPEIDRLRGVAARMGVEDRLTFAGAVSQEELPAYYSAADVCVLPSYYESFGLAALGVPGLRHTRSRFEGRRPHVLHRG